MNNRPFIWTDDLADEIAKDQTVMPEATWIAWVAVILGPLMAAALVAWLLRS